MSVAWAKAAETGPRTPAGGLIANAARPRSDGSDARIANVSILLGRLKRWKDLKSGPKSGRLE